MCSPLCILSVPESRCSILSVKHLSIFLGLSQLEVASLLPRHAPRRVVKRANWAPISWHGSLLGQPRHQCRVHGQQLPSVALFVGKWHHWCEIEHGSSVLTAIKLCEGILLSLLSLIKHGKGCLEVTLFSELIGFKMLDDPIGWQQTQLIGDQQVV